MKKLVAFAAVVAAVSFASCGNKSSETAEVAEATEAEVFYFVTKQIYLSSGSFIENIISIL